MFLKQISYSIIGCKDPEEESKALRATCFNVKAYAGKCAIGEKNGVRARRDRVEFEDEDVNGNTRCMSFSRKKKACDYGEYASESRAQEIVNACKGDLRKGTGPSIKKLDRGYVQIGKEFENDSNAGITHSK